MPPTPYIPHDELVGPTPDADLAADICELSAFFSPDSRFLLSNLRNDLEIGEDEYDDLEDQNMRADVIVESAAKTLSDRESLAGIAYPFELNASGTELLLKDFGTWGKQAYLLSLFLSHVETVTPVLKEAGLAPDEAAVRKLRNWFQEVSATVLAAEVSGKGWAFGWPRPDGSSFFNKLHAIWRVVGDGSVHQDEPDGAPARVKDDEIDVIAARPHEDGDPGFPIMLAQVASGKNWRDKSVRSAVDNVFFDFWFAEQPASQRLSYHIIPFALSKDDARRQTMRLGHILARLRVTQLAESAEAGVAAGRIESEGTDAYQRINNWLLQYRNAYAV